MFTTAKRFGAIWKVQGCMLMRNVKRVRSAPFDISEMSRWLIGSPRTKPMHREGEFGETREKQLLKKSGIQ